MGLRNFTRNICMFLDSVELWLKKTKKNSWGKTVLKIWSQICRKMTYCVQINALKKSTPSSFYVFGVFTFFCTFLKANWWTNIAILPQIWDQISKQFFLHYFFLFSTQSLKLSKNMHKLRVKLRNATIYPPWGPIFKNIFSLKTHSSLIWNARLAPKVTFEIYQWE